jgi:hypothetical protein
MSNPETNPLFVVLFFILRCLVPLAIMLGISYLLRRFGFIAEPPRPPDDSEEVPESSNHTNGGIAHGKV